jgi:hypothetical protein
MVFQGAVMNELVNFSEKQYVAEPCIIAFGFSSREEAAATANPCILAAAA